MAKIAIGVCGEGRGHAARMAVLVEHLQHKHEIVMYSFAEGLEFLRRRFPAGASPVRVEQIPGIVFRYTRGRIDLPRSIAAGLHYKYRQVWPLVDRLFPEIEKFGADLVVTDFEPALPRVAARYGIPFVSVDHQHFLRAYDLGSLPLLLRVQAFFMSHVVSMYIKNPADTVVSAFFRPPLRRAWNHVEQTGPLMRRDFLRAEPSEGDFVLSYLRRHTPASALDALAGCGLPVKVYGLGQRERVGDITFHAIDENRFIEDLAACGCMVSSAGNQLIGEALHLGKPMLLLPERAHAEQSMNSHFLAGLGCGDFVYVEDVTRERVRQFTGQLERFRPALLGVRGRMDSTSDVVRVIERRLAKKRS
ncbi:MAG: glycosyltransferase family protein [Limisphaerales bacterium]